MGHGMCRSGPREGKRIFGAKFHMARLLTKGVVIGRFFFQGRHLPVISGVACITPISRVNFHPKETNFISLHL